MAGQGCIRRIFLGLSGTTSATSGPDCRAHSDRRSIRYEGGTITWGQESWGDHAKHGREPGSGIHRPLSTAQAAASAGTILRGRLLEPTNALEDQSSREQLEALRRQVIAFQRISSLGVLAGGVFHELNNALTPILNYAKLGLRNPDPAYRERALTQIVEAASEPRRSPGGCSACPAPAGARAPRADRSGPAGA